MSKSELTWSPFACTIHKWASYKVYFKERCIDSGNLSLSMLKNNTMNIRQKQKKHCIIIPIQSIDSRLQFHQFVPTSQCHLRRQSRKFTRNFHLAHHLCTRPRPESRNQRESLQTEQTNLPDPIAIISYCCQFIWREVCRPGRPGREGSLMSSQCWRNSERKPAGGRSGRWFGHRCVGVVSIGIHKRYKIKKWKLSLPSLRKRHPEHKHKLERVVECYCGILVACSSPLYLWEFLRNQ